jgi:tripartite-type tricarboxylate transporter receptor subunit TctC
VTITRRVLAAVALLAAAFAGLSSAAAQSYPDKPIKIIVPFASGGPMDTMARLVGQKLSANLGQPVIVENRAGAGGTIGSKAVATADPDGYTLLWASSGTLAIAPALYKNLDYDPKAFVPVALLSKLPHAFVVTPGVPANTVQEFVAYATANPGKLNYGASLGTPPHLMGAMFTKMSGTDIQFIPYKGAAPSIADMLGGRTQLTFDALTVLSSLIAEGKLRALAITSLRRWPGLPDVPTMTECGFAGFPTDAWQGIVAPRGTPQAVVDKLNHAINAAMGSPEVADTLFKLSAVANLGSPQDFAAWIAAESPIWAEMVRVAGARVD